MITEIIPGKNWLLDSEFGSVQLELSMVSEKTKLVTVLKAVFIPTKNIIPSCLSVEILTLPHDASKVIKTSPLTRTEMAGKRDIFNRSTDNSASWDLFYNHPTEKYSSWTVQGEFDSEKATLLEINVRVSVKQTIMSKILKLPNCVHWPAIQLLF